MMKFFSVMLLSFMSLGLMQEAEAHEVRTVCENVKTGWVWVPAVVDSRGRILVDGHYTYNVKRNCRNVVVHRHPRVIIRTHGHTHHHHHHHRRKRVTVKIKL